MKNVRGLRSVCATENYLFSFGFSFSAHAHEIIDVTTRSIAVDGSVLQTILEMRLLYHWSLVYILLLGSLLPLQTKARLLNKSKGTVTTPNPNGLASSSSSLLTSRRRQQRQRQQQPTWRRKKDADVPAVPIRASWKQDLVHRSKIGLYFALWYALNIIYNSKYCNATWHESCSRQQNFLNAPF